MWLPDSMRIVRFARTEFSRWPGIFGMLSQCAWREAFGCGFGTDSVPHQVMRHRRTHANKLGMGPIERQSQRRCGAATHAHARRPAQVTITLDVEDDSIASFWKEFNPESWATVEAAGVKSISQCAARTAGTVAHPSRQHTRVPEHAMLLHAERIFNR